METEIAYEIKRELRLESDNDSRNTDLIIRFPKRSKSDEPIYCLCTCEPLIKENTKIFGSDELHALTLCMWFCVQEFNAQKKYAVSWTEKGDMAGLNCISRPQ